MKIVVLGAYGYTGELICKMLSAKAIPYSIAGRKTEKLQYLREKYQGIETSYVLEMQNEKSVAEIVVDNQIFVNCVGPFSETADILLDLVTQEKKLYLDITGEIEFVHASKLKYHDRAQTNKSTIVHSCAFESVLVNLMAHRIIDDTTEVKSIHAYYHTAKSKASPGTRLTMKLAKYRKDFHYIDGKQELVKNIPRHERVVAEIGPISAAPFALPEICFAKWDTSAKDIGSFLLMDTYDASYVNKLKPTAINFDEKTALLAKFDKRRPPGPTDDLREQQEFDIRVEVKNNAGQLRIITLEGKDYYGLSAEIAVYFAEFYMNGKLQETGVLSPIRFLGKENTFFHDLKLQLNEK